MTVSGTVQRVTRRVKAHGSVYLTVEVDGVRLRYLQTWQAVPARGDKITVTGVPIIGRKDANIGAARVTIHDTGRRP